MRAVLVAAVCIAGCKDTPTHDSAGPTTAPLDRSRCDAAIRTASTAPPASRPGLLLDGCRVCGDWTPIVRWNTPTAQGGPKRIDIEKAMDACHAYCVGDAKLKFLGTLDDARGTGSRMPWKQLALLCRDDVSAVPDARYVDGVYFALDRIARTIGSDALATVDVPLPAVSITGNGPPLPAVTMPESTVSSDLLITVLGGTISIGTMPTARLTKDGIRVSLGADGYPGKTVSLDGLAAALTARGPSHTATILAPRGVPAQTLVDVVARAAPVLPVYLGVRAAASPEGWDLPTAIPVRLDAGSDLVVTPEMTVQQLADALATRPPGDHVGIHAP